MKYMENFTPRTRELLKKLAKFLVLLLFLGAVAYLLNPGRMPGTAIPRYQGTYAYKEASWVFRQEDQILEEGLTVPAFRHMKTGETYSISTTLTYDGREDENPYGFYFVDHMFTRVLLDGELIFSYTAEDIRKPDPSKSPGNVYVSFPLPEDCRGMELTIEFIPALDSDIEYQLPNPHFGDYATDTVTTFRGDLPHNMVAIISAALGIASILFATLALTGSAYREGLSIGIFAVLCSMYNLTESDFDFYVISNPYFTYVLDYTTFTLIPITLMAFLRERLTPRRRPLATVFIVIGLAAFALEMFLHFTGRMDVREFLPMLHVLFFGELLILFLSLLTMKENRWKKQLILQMIPILLGLMTDAAVYYQHWQLGSSDSTFTSVGVLIFLVAELFHVWRYSIDVYMESMESKNYREMAYVDALSGIGNRRAFEVEKNAIAEGTRKFRSLILASVDVNDLKQTNDSFGHAAGDFLIRNAANVLSDLSEDWGHAYRTGGDEFLVLLYDMDEEELKQRLQNMNREIDDINSISETKLSLALGYEIVHGTNLEAAMEIADKKMYQNKAEHKARLAKIEKF